MKLPPSPAGYRSHVFRAYLRYLASTTKPIVIGPWRSELGFEVLYWMPMIAWALKRYGIAPERCIALSRGGMGALYHVGRHADLYSLRTVDQVRIENTVDYETRKLQKQTQVTAWDRLVATEAAEGPHHLLHPSWMYWLLEGFWEERNTFRLVAEHCDYSPMPMPVLPDGFELPKKFVAVRFYERHTFPLQDQVKEIAADMVQGLAQRHPVVLLNQSLFADDHTDLPLSGENIFALPAVSPETNFLMQAAVLARSSAFIGTYGGVAQWALRYGKPSLSFYTDFRGTAQAHRTLSNILAAGTNTPFEVADLRALRLWQAALTKVQEEVAA